MRTDCKGDTLATLMENSTLQQHTKVEARAAELVARKLAARGSSQVVSKPTYGSRASEDIL